MILHERTKTTVNGARPSSTGYAPVSTGSDYDKVPMTPTMDKMDDDNDNDNDTLVGENPDSPRNMMSRETLIKGNRSEATVTIKASMGDIDDDIAFGRRWGFWEIIALKQVQNMLASLFLISWVASRSCPNSSPTFRAHTTQPIPDSFTGGAWGAVSLLFFYTPTASG